MKNIVESADYSDSFNAYVFAEVSPQSICLDIGCWTGNLGEALIRRKNCVVDGLDFNPAVLEVAKRRGYQETFCINLNGRSLDITGIDKKYDTIIFADVLEHIINPQGVLETFTNYLKPSGNIIISLPNVAFVLNRLNLFLGKWEYGDYGTLDKTHLKFYTISSGKALVKSAGLTVSKVFPYYQFGLAKIVNPLVKLFPTLFAYQFLIVAKAPQHE